MNTSKDYPLILATLLLSLLMGVWAGAVIAFTLNQEPVPTISLNTSPDDVYCPITVDTLTLWKGCSE